MQVNRHTEALAFGKDGPKERIVVETAFFMIVHQRAHESKFLDTTLELVGASGTIAHGNHSEAGKATLTPFHS